MSQSLQGPGVAGSFRSRDGGGGSRRGSSVDFARPSSPCGDGGGGGVASEVADCLGEWWSSDPAQRPEAARAAERLEAAAAAAAAEADTEAERRRSRTSLSLPAALRLPTLPPPPAPSRSRRGSGGLCVCWGRGGLGPGLEED